MANTLYDAQIKLLNERVMQLETRSTLTEKTVGDAYWEGRRDEHDSMRTKFDEKHSEGFCCGVVVSFFVWICNFPTVHNQIEFDRKITNV